MKKISVLFQKPNSIIYSNLIRSSFCSGNSDILETEVKKKRVIFSNLSPYQRWLSFGNGYERPFTGLHWDTMNVGSYHCGTCSNELFK